MVFRRTCCSNFDVGDSSCLVFGQSVCLSLGLCLVSNDGLGLAIASFKRRGRGKGTQRDGGSDGGHLHFETIVVRESGKHKKRTTERRMLMVTETQFYTQTRLFM